MNIFDDDSHGPEMAPTLRAADWGSFRREADLLAAKREVKQLEGLLSSAKDRLARLNPNPSMFD